MVERIKEPSAAARSFIAVLFVCFFFVLLIVSTYKPALISNLYPGGIARADVVGSVDGSISDSSSDSGGGAGCGSTGSGPGGGGNGDSAGTAGNGDSGSADTGW